MRGVCTRNARLSMTRVRERDFSSTSRCAAARSRGDVALVSVVRFPRVPRNDARMSRRVRDEGTLGEAETSRVGASNVFADENENEVTCEAETRLETPRRANPTPPRGTHACAISTAHAEKHETHIATRASRVSKAHRVSRSRLAEKRHLEARPKIGGGLPPPHALLAARVLVPASRVWGARRRGPRPV